MQCLLTTFYASKILRYRINRAINLKRFFDNSGSFMNKIKFANMFVGKYRPYKFCNSYFNYFDN